MRQLTRMLERSIIVAWVIIGVCLAVFAFWAADRNPPFRMEGRPNVEVIPGQNGTQVNIAVAVARDLGRKCDVDYSRFFYDGSGRRFDLTPSTHMTSEGIELMDGRAPGQLLISFIVPPSAVPGRSELVTMMEYTCNPVHRLWPIRVTTRLPFTLWK